MKIYDISMEISEEMVVYKDKPEKKPKIFATRTLKEGANESRIEMDAHSGSHVDAPFHFFENGKTIDKINLGKFMGNCAVIDFTKIDKKGVKIDKVIKALEELRDTV